MTHLNMPGVWRVCKKFGFDFKKAVTGFDYSKNQIYPIIEGVIVLTKNKNKIVKEYK